MLAHGILAASTFIHMVLTSSLDHNTIYPNAFKGSHRDHFTPYWDTDVEDNQDSYNFHGWKEGQGFPEDNNLPFKEEWSQLHIDDNGSEDVYWPYDQDFSDSSSLVLEDSLVLEEPNKVPVTDRIDHGEKPTGKIVDLDWVYQRSRPKDDTKVFKEAVGSSNIILHDVSMGHDKYKKEHKEKNKMRRAGNTAYAKELIKKRQFSKYVNQYMAHTGLEKPVAQYRVKTRITKQITDWLDSKKEEEVKKGIRELSCLRPGDLFTIDETSLIKERMIYFFPWLERSLTSLILAKGSKTYPKNKSWLLLSSTDVDFKEGYDLLYQHYLINNATYLRDWRGTN